MNISYLQIGLIAGAIILVIIAVLILTGTLPGLRIDTGPAAHLVMWGFDNPEIWKDIIISYQNNNPNVKIFYQQKNINTFDSDFINALASGVSPDVVIFPSNYFFKEKTKLAAAPINIFTESNIAQNFIPAASIYVSLTKEILAAPLSADALVLYYNNDLFSRHFITTPPATWDDFLDAAQKLTEKDSAGNIIISGAALGRAGNIKNAPQILTTLFLQAGEKIIDSAGTVVLGNAVKTGGADVRPAESSMIFFSSFANSQKVSQSWSLALPEAKDMFIGGKLAMYIGSMNDFFDIKNKNPHLSFAVSLIPQLKGAVHPITGGELFGLVVPKMSQNQTAAWLFIKSITDATISQTYADKIGSVSLQKNLLPGYLTNPTLGVFAHSVFDLQLWPKPDSVSSDQILRSLIEDVALGNGTIRDSFARAQIKLQNLLTPQQ